MKNFITQQRLKELVSYCPTTGAFTGKTGKRAGKVAGSINKVKGYVYLRADGHRYMAHRLAWLYMYGEFPDGDIDHINRVKHDNSITNLRVVTKSENQRNRPMNKNNTSGATGVYKNSNKWVAQITLKGVLVVLGSYTTKVEAIAARGAADVANNFNESHGKDITNGL